MSRRLVEHGACHAGCKVGRGKGKDPGGIFGRWQVFERGLVLLDKIFHARVVEAYLSAHRLECVVDGWRFRHRLGPHAEDTNACRSPATWAMEGDVVSYRSRIPGGIGVIVDMGKKISFVASGQIWEAEEDVLALLALIHGLDSITPAQISKETGLPQVWCAEVANELSALGLVRRG